ncbi:MAG: hypothetical protein ACT4N2_04660 [Hyphomicrobium sp.]
MPQLPAASTTAKGHRRLARAGQLLAIAIVLLTAAPVSAQTTDNGWTTGVEGNANGTTTITRTTPEGDADAAQAGPSQVRLVALLTADGQSIDKGMIWHVFQNTDGADGQRKLVSTHRDPSPLVKLDPGEYMVNAAFGRANLTRKITVAAGKTPAIEQFVLNAGGLRLAALVGSSAAPANTVSFDIQTDRDQSDSRTTVMSGARPGLIIRLNAGIYHIVSTYGDANATVEADVTVEAGKLTEAQVTHTAAKTTLKLVARPGGEALSDTQWTIQTKDGRVVKESVGALPTHLLAPGSYTAIARNQSKSYTETFDLVDGQTSVVEVVMAASAPQ